MRRDVDHDPWNPGAEEVWADVTGMPHGVHLTMTSREDDDDPASPLLVVGTVLTRREALGMALRLVRACRHVQRGQRP